MDFQALPSQPPTATSNQPASLVVSNDRSDFANLPAELGASKSDCQPGSIQASGRWAVFLELAHDHKSAALLASMSLHLLIMLLLALLKYGGTLDGPQAQQGVISVSIATNDRLQDSTEINLVRDVSSAVTSLQLPPQTGVHPKSPLAIDADLAPLLDGSTQPASFPPMDQLMEQWQAVSRHAMSASFIESSVEGRSTKHRQQLALSGGGSQASEQAVEAALQWLAAHQLPSGGWSLVHDRGQCQGRCPNPGSPDRLDPAGTGLALLAFLGAGYTHQQGPYQQPMQRGIYYLKQVVEHTPRGANFEYQCQRGMYNHGIAALALCEAFQMTGDTELEPLCQKAIDYIVNAQDYSGGWGYRPKQPGDLTISGWQSMALKSAAAGGLDVSPTTLWRIGKFIETQRSVDEWSYFYREPRERSMACTAIGLLLRMFLGSSRTDPSTIEGLKRLVAHQSPGRADIYYRYYATLALFHAGGSLWEQWNAQSRDYLIATQETEGHLAGSWYFDDPFGKEGGRLYTTAMAAMILEVYYRYAPLYKQADQPFSL
ncbi:MAG: terpene cyclase/mutase family protein [Pirellulaceae bacterium]|nr:terpene cyclase/mutase family protein [Pirellulaceae bacterium]